MTFGIPSFSFAGPHGFSVGFVNGISSIKYNYGDGAPATEIVSVRDPAPGGTGEWVQAPVARWDAQWVRTKWAK